MINSKGETGNERGQGKRLVWKAESTDSVTQAGQLPFQAEVDSISIEIGSSGRPYCRLAATYEPQVAGL